MATYVNDLRLKEIGTGESSGTWGSETNTNLELIGEALGFGTEAITTNADTHTTTVADGSTDPGRAMYIKYTGTLDSACTITIAPNTMSRMHFIENGTSGSQNIIISQGTGANVTIPAGDVKAVYLDGAGSGAAVTDAFASLNVVDLKVEDDLTVTDDVAISGLATVGGTLGVTGAVTANAGVNIDNISIDGTTIALSSGNLTLDVAGNLILDADGGEFQFHDGGTNILEIANSSSDVIIRPAVQDKDLKFNGNDGGGAITALTLDMSDAGSAYFNNKIGVKQTSPANNVHIEIDAGGEGILVKGTGDHSALLQFNVNGSSSNSVLGQLLGTWNGTDVADIQLKTADDTTNKDNGQITFSTSTADNLSERMRLNDAGSLAIGNTSPQAKLHATIEGSVPTISSNTVAVFNRSGGLSHEAYVSIIGGATGASTLQFGDTADEDIGKIEYRHASGDADHMAFTVAGSEVVKIDSSNELSTTHSATAHTSGLNIINSQAGGYGSALKLQSERSDNNAIVTAARIRTEGAEAWNADNAVSSVFIFESVQDNSLNERFRVTSGGSVLFGTTATPDGTSNGGSAFMTDSAGRMNLFIATTTTSAAEIANIFNGNGLVGRIVTESSGTTYQTSSDYRLKENVNYDFNGLERLKKLKPARFNFKTDKDTTFDGFLAHEVQEIVPEAVGGEKDGEEMQSMDYGRITPLLVKAIQEQQEQIDALQSEINILKGE